MFDSKLVLFLHESDHTRLGFIVLSPLDLSRNYVNWWSISFFALYCFFIDNLEIAFVCYIITQSCMEMIGHLQEVFEYVEWPLLLIHRKGESLAGVDTKFGTRPKRAQGCNFVTNRWCS